MTILFHNTTFDKIDVWKKTIKKYFKNEKIISIKDYKKFNDVNCAIIWNLPDDILSRLKNLKVIFSMGAGVDHILKLKNYNKKIPVIRIKDEEMGERINFKIFQNSQSKHYWSGERTPIDNKNLTVGILGLGFLGNHIARLLNKLNYNVIAYKKNQKKVKNIKIYTGKNILSFIKSSDVIVSILPSTPQTNNIIDKKFLKNMKKNSCLINIGRGNAIEEKDLLNHLKKNKNFYAYLDVFKNEPLKSSSQFWKLPNVTITPHVAGVTAIEPSVKYMHSKYIKLRKNKNVKSDVNPSNGY
jgi:glyoxylate/hydroxypyruvate reductase A